MDTTYDDRYNKSESATRYIKQRVADIAPTYDTDDDSPSKREHKIKPALWTSVMAGGIAGVVVDISLYPLDTIKTRLQSENGFKDSGGFRGVYKGIIPVLLGSAPISALFFATYNTLINTLRTDDSTLNPVVYLVAATAAEVACATVRVPLEVVKQRKQISNITSVMIIQKILQKEGFSGFYRGFWSTLLREVPFAAIQYPLWEYMITQFIIYENGKELTALQTAYCGAAAGAIAAGLTTPMDVIKTRIMLEEKEKIERYKPYLNYNFAKEIYHTRGVFGLFAGAVPRVLWIMLGGFIYFGAYEKAKLLWESNWKFVVEPTKANIEVSPTYCDETELSSSMRDSSCQKDNFENPQKEEESIESQEVYDLTDLESSRKLQKEIENIEN